MSTKISRKIITLTCLILINSSFILAQDVNDVLRVAIPGLGSDARALGMGNSYIALSDDGSASFFNPAGLGLLKRLEFTGGLSYADLNNDVTFFNNSTSYSNSNTKLNQLSFAFPFPTLQGSLVFALSYHTTKDLTGAIKFNGFNNTNTSLIQDFLNTDLPYDLYLTDLNNNTPISGNLNQSGSILNTGSLNNWTFSGAIEVYKNLFIGGNLNIISGNYKSNNDYYEDDTKHLYQGRTDPTDSTTLDFTTFHLNRLLDWDISGWDAKIGLLYQLENNSRFGLTVQFPKTYDIKEKFTVNGSSEFGSGYTYNLNTDKYSDNVEYEITTPFELGAGFSVNYVGLIFSAQATIIDYSQATFKNVDGLSDKYAEDLNKNIKDQLRAVFNYNLGVEYNVPGGLRIRGGYFVQPSPYQGDPSEFNRKYLTAGIGFLTNETVGLDLAYAYGWRKDIGDNYGTNVSRTYQDVKTNQFIMTGTYRF
jgi:Outer membrane protein transport protein (OMPP1/FadL/TodX)